MLKKMIRRLAIILAIMALLGSTTLSADAEKAISVNLNEIQTWAAADNADHDRLFDELADARTALANAEDNKGSGGGEVNWKKSLEYDIIAAQLTIDKVIYAVEKSVKSLEKEARDVYFDLQFLTEQIAIVEMTRDMQKASLAETEDKYNLGMVTDIEISEAELSLLEFETQLIQLGYSYESTLLALNQLINKPLLTAYEFKDEEIPSFVIDVILTDEQVEEAVGNSMALDFLEQDKELLELEIDIYKKLNNDDDYDSIIRKLRDQLLAKEYAIEDKILEIKTDVYKGYNDVLNAKDALKVSELTLEIKKMELMIAEDQYDMDLILSTEVNKCEKAVAMAELDIKKAELDLLDAIEAYQTYV